MQMLDVAGRLVVAVDGDAVEVEAASSGRFEPDPHSAFDDWASFSRWAETQVDADAAPADEGVLGPPVPWPAEVVRDRAEHRAHAEGSSLAVPTLPPALTNIPTCLTGPQADVPLPADTVDREVELVVMLGERAEHVAVHAAWKHIAGVMVGQYLSERRLQTVGPAPRFSLSNSFPGFGPIRPALVTVGNPDNPELGCQLEGCDVLQQGRTSDMVFPVPELIAHLSSVCPLLPGDLISPARRPASDANLGCSSGRAASWSGGWVGSVATATRWSPPLRGRPPEPMTGYAGGDEPCAG
jgi:2,4-didehydro-3-deoxy-L-rhamnonate hydrolase